MNIAVVRKFTTSEPLETCILPIHEFFEIHRGALRNAARLLGGVDATRLVDEITDALSSNDDLSRRTIGLLHDLEDLLALENVGDPDRPEAGYFAAIDILDTVVDEICLLTDGLREALDVPSEMLFHSSPPNLHSPNVLAVCATSTEDVQ